MNSLTVRPVFVFVLVLAVSPTRAPAQDGDASLQGLLKLQSVSLFAGNHQANYSDIDVTNGWQPPVETGSMGGSASIKVRVITPGKHWQVIEDLEKTSSTTVTHSATNIVFYSTLPGESVIAHISSFLPSNGGGQGTFAMTLTAQSSRCIVIEPGCTLTACGMKPCTFSPNTYLTETWASGGEQNSPDGMLNAQATASEYSQTMTTDIVVGAIPINFHQVSVTSYPNGVLGFGYQWESSSGNPGDLKNCTVGEQVKYNGSSPFHPPSPPYSLLLGAAPNPTTSSGPATTVKGTDNHCIGNCAKGTNGAPEPINQSCPQSSELVPLCFVKPYSTEQPNSYSSTQAYTYKCTDNTPNPESFPGWSGIPITRTFKNTLGCWFYKVEKPDMGTGKFYASSVKVSCP